MKLYFWKSRRLKLSVCSSHFAHKRLCRKGLLLLIIWLVMVRPMVQFSLCKRRYWSWQYRSRKGERHWCIRLERTFKCRPTGRYRAGTILAVSWTTKTVQKLLFSERVDSKVTRSPGKSTTADFSFVRVSSDLYTTLSDIYTRMLSVTDFGSAVIYMCPMRI